MTTETLYFCDDEYRERVSAIVTARTALGHNCRLAISAAEARLGVTCMFIATPRRIGEYEGRIALAESLGARIDHSSIEGEERRYSIGEVAQPEYAAYRVPRTPQEFYGFWYQKLDSHARHWQPRTTKRGVLGELFLMVGGTGVGKSCSVKSVLVNSIRLSLRLCDLYVVDPGEVEEPQPGGTKRASTKPSTGNLIDDADNSDLVAAGTRLASCYRAALEHVRKIRSRQLASTALFIAFFDDLEDVMSRATATAYLSTLSKLTALAVKQPRNIALIASCDSWWNSPSPLVKALRTDAERLPYAVVLCDIKPPTVEMLFECLQKCYGARSKEEKARIAKSSGARGDFNVALQNAANAANGNFRAAFHIAEYGAQSSDEFQNSASARHLQMLVQRVAASKPALSQYNSADAAWKRKAKLSPLLFDEIDRQCDIDYADESIFSNYRALVPKSYARPELDDNELTTLERISDVSEFLSCGDLYGMRQRDTHYAGRDGVDVDNQMLTALTTTAPILLLGIATRNGKPASGQFDLSGTNARASRESLRKNAELIIEMRPVFDILSSRGANPALALAIETATYGVRRVRHANLSQAIATIEMLDALGVQPYVWLRRYGLTEKQAIEVMVFAQQFSDGRKSTDAVSSECAKLERQNKAQVPELINLKAQAVEPLSDDEKTTERTTKAPAKKPAVKRSLGVAKKMTDYYAVSSEVKKPKLEPAPKLNSRIGKSKRASK